MKKLIKRFNIDAMSVAIFRNDTDGMSWVKISKTYKTADGKSHETTYYKPEELLPMARLIAAVSKWLKTNR
jgi:hypothetical protein